MGAAYTTRTRDCCGTTYDCEHMNDRPERGVAARAALPCDITPDGWCAAHSTGGGPTFCQPAAL